jgi:hypothetical protein
MLLISLPVYDDETEETYSSYHVTLSSAEKSIGQQMLRAPKISSNRRRHILSIDLFPQRLPERGAYDLRVEGQTQSGWQSLGHVLLNPLSRKD